MNFKIHRKKGVEKYANKNYEKSATWKINELFHFIRKVSKTATALL